MASHPHYRPQSRHMPSALSTNMTKAKSEAELETDPAVLPMDVDVDLDLGAERPGDGISAVTNVEAPNGDLNGTEPDGQTAAATTTDPTTVPVPVGGVTDQPPNNPDDLTGETTEEITLDSVDVYRQGSVNKVVVRVEERDAAEAVEEERERDKDRESGQLDLVPEALAGLA
jgi:hypothetical protein